MSLDDRAGTADLTIVHRPLARLAGAIGQRLVRLAWQRSALSLIGKVHHGPGRSGPLR